MLPDSEIVAILAEADGRPDRAAEALVDAANRAGGEDNITVVLLEIVEGDPAEAGTAAPAPEPDRRPSNRPCPRAVGARGAGRSRAGAAPRRGRRRPLARAGRDRARVVVAGLVIWWSLGR